MSNINKYITEEIAGRIRNEISDAKGREVFFVGHTNDKSIVVDLDVLARGNDISVAAITQLANYGDVLIHNHPSETSLEPSDADIGISSVAACSGIASFIINNEVSEIYVLVEPMKPPKLKPLPEKKLLDILSKDGKISKLLIKYEERAPQIDMLKESIDAFNHNKISIIEAGTGTGKTLAYLIPAVSWALKNGERVVISTHTINLQEQILQKDIPIIKSIFEDEEIKATLVKGRRNYVCLRKSHNAEDTPELFSDEESEELQQLLDWAFITKTGDLSDINQKPSWRVWEKIHSSAETCFRARCPHFRECFVLKARRNAASANVLVTNHALLFSDIAIRAESDSMSESTILPKYNRIIFDEAHNIEEVATAHFGSNVSKSYYLRTLNLLHRRNRGQETGSLNAFVAQLLKNKKKLGDDKLVDELIVQIQSVANTDITTLRFAVNDSFEWLATNLLEKNKDERGAVQYRITPERRKSDFWEEIIGKLDGLKKKTRKFVSALSKIVKEIDSLPIEDEKVMGALLDVKSNIEKLKSFADTIDFVCNDENENFVNWLEAKVSNTYTFVSVNRAPLTIVDSMITEVYEKFPTIIMTSATLSSRKKFDFFNARTGIKKYKAMLKNTNEEIKRARPVTEIILSTPFDYKKQAIVGIPTDVNISFYQNNNDCSEDHDLKDAIMSLLEVSKGSAFVLFTSYGLLKKTAKELQDKIEDAGMNLLVQGQGNRSDILKRFRSESNSVLFGTDSFWAGVDVTGDALTSVIITKLPFRVPTEPIIEARSESIDTHGGNSFMEYTIPMAVLKFRQGFGRLIRCKSDYGMVAILDRRVIDKYYGKWFLQSLPESVQLTGNLVELAAAAREFFTEHQSIQNGL